MTEDSDEATRLHGVVQELLPKLALKDEEIAALTKERDMWKASYEQTCELFHAKCAEIAALTEQRDRAMAVARAFYKFAPRPWIEGANATWPELDGAYAEAEALFAALDTQSSPSLPESP